MAAMSLSALSSIPGGFSQGTQAKALSETARTNSALPVAPAGHNRSTPAFARGAWDRLRSTRQRRAGPGWTNAHAKRVASKKRRVKAHRARG